MGRLVKGLVRLGGGGALPFSLTSYSVVGAAAFLGGSTRMTLTATVMVMETTGSLQLIIPLMLAVFFSKVLDEGRNGCFRGVLAGLPPKKCGCRPFPGQKTALVHGLVLYRISPRMFQCRNCVWRLTRTP